MSQGKVSINNKQFRDILICSAWPTAINYASGFLAREVGRDMWISGIISILTTLPFIYIIIYIGRKYPGKTIIEYSRDLLGNIAGKLLGLILSVYFLAVAVSSVSMYIHHLTDYLLPETPFLVVTTAHIFVICYMVWKGPEVIARTAVIGFSLSIVFFILVFMASVTEINPDRILPLFDYGLAADFKASLKADTFTGISYLVIAMVLPMVSNPKKAFSSAAAGTLIGGLFFVFYFMVELTVMGPYVVSIMRIASMDFVRSIQITQYLHRFESFMMALWYWSILVQTCMSSFCSLEAFMQTTGIKKKNPLIMVVFSIILVVFTYILGRNRIQFLNIREHKWQYFVLPIQFIIPILLLLILSIKKAVKTKKG